MLYNQFQELKLSALGFGTMRLPLLPGGGQGDIDQQAVNEMTAYAIEHGVNYFDTAYPYHDCKSELAIAEALSAFPRESWYLADKFPGHQVVKGLGMPVEATFEEQLKKCRVDYFDFYLLHNVNEHSMAYYMDESNGCIEYFLRQRELGRVRHLGFSCHAAVDGLEQFLDKYGEHMEFCQIQLNYLDWTLQSAAYPSGSWSRSTAASSRSSTTRPRRSCANAGRARARRPRPSAGSRPCRSPRWCSAACRTWSR